MIVSAYYNKYNDVLMISKATNDQNLSSRKEDNKVIITDSNDEVVGINIFNPQGEYENGLNDIKVIKEEGISKYMKTDLENPFCIGYVKAIEDHPESTKLHICQIDLGDEVVQIVCGAANIDKDMKVVVAKVGAVMPNGMNILPSKLLKVDSFGMVCSGRELNKEQSYPGIMVIENDYQIGQDFI